MQDAALNSLSSLDLLAQGLEAARRAVRRTLVEDAGIAEDRADTAAAAVERIAWEDLLRSEPPVDLAATLSGAALAAAAAALRAHGVPAGGAPEPTPSPEGLTAEALRGAQLEVIPGRRSVAGMHLRGYRPEEMAPVYDLDLEAMRDRLASALQDLRASLHRRAQRMNQAGWSRGLETVGIEATFGMLRERPAAETSRLRCATAEDMALAVNGTHFRGGREGVLDHAIHCDPCALELRVLVRLLHAERPAPAIALDAAAMDAMRRSAAARPALRDLLDATAPPRRRRRLWPWLLLGAAGIALWWVL